MNSFRICNSGWLEFSYQYVKASRVGMSDDDYEGGFSQFFTLRYCRGVHLYV